MDDIDTDMHLAWFNLRQFLFNTLPHDEFVSLLEEIDHTLREILTPSGLAFDAPPRSELVNVILGRYMQGAYTAAQQDELEKLLSVFDADAAKPKRKVGRKPKFEAPVTEWFDTLSEKAQRLPTNSLAMSYTAEKNAASVSLSHARLIITKIKKVRGID